mmetsp:Transcript_14159/g.2267  ORF Transcript_14159/g.2267 Transcript_14159/m.2267 type:complete len:94 (+) Transcript_14159:194-475(+)
MIGEGILIRYLEATGCSIKLYNILYLLVIFTSIAWFIFGNFYYYQRDSKCFEGGKDDVELLTFILLIAGYIALGILIILFCCCLLCICLSQKS